MNASALLLPISFFVAFSVPLLSQADTFGTGENAFTIDFVTIGDPGNAADTTGDPNPAGAVSYTYRMGKYEIPEHAIRRANAATENTANPLGITLDQRGPDKPATRVSWFEAARFVNYLNEDQGAPPAYKFDSAGEFQLWELGDPGYDPANPFRNSLARYFLPSADEWYKAAFYDPESDTWFDYPNGMNTPPLPVASGADANTAVIEQDASMDPADVWLAGGSSPFGTVAQAGNVWEWEESETDLVNDERFANRAFRGGDRISGSSSLSISSSFRHDIYPPDQSIGAVGFRVASRNVPEPNSMVLLLVALVFGVAAKRWHI
ncbi:formylglycine-generating enzyme family protein [Aeoliella sp. ICT_H6.2]|uniref:Formylglycine-generating enzyme family protein n=1 Tax=Aeoliella straminimaris TaxID=2954799 RepID=A0A9X2F8V6_9BACT|nr:SUMF1/EgtB/PvdO family nonheme iron enzyme [Aeoliella straminimaris]MCO6043793.1 formylglycine-generating enzyme family protein [Aeoliella straminimaris]